VPGVEAFNLYSRDDTPQASLQPSCGFGMAAEGMKDDEIKNEG
jgi:hypothetical protein